MEAHRPTWPSLLLVSLFLFPVLFPAMASAEHSLEAGKKALSFALPSGGGALVGGTYFLSQREAVHVDFGYSVTIPDGGDKIGGFSIVPAYIKYLSVGRMATFVKGAANISKVPGVSFSDALTLDLGGFFGVEFFLLPQLSISGEIGAAINFRDKFKTITSQAGTGALFASFYF